MTKIKMFKELRQVYNRMIEEDQKFDNDMTIEVTLDLLVQIGKAFYKAEIENNDDEYDNLCLLHEELAFIISTMIQNPKLTFKQVKKMYIETRKIVNLNCCCKN